MRDILNFSSNEFEHLLREKCAITPPDKYEKFIGKRYYDFTSDDFKKIHLLEIREYNNSKGNLNEYDGIDCEICLNRGDFKGLNEYGNDEYANCSCWAVRREKRQLIKMGLGVQLKTCTLNSYMAKEVWQAKVLQSAKRYLDDYARNWFFIAGQPGSGKTHICIALINELFNKKVKCKYIRWCDFIKQAQALNFKEKEYSELLNEVKNAEVLYIDDFFKPIKGELPSVAEIRLAFEVIDYRYASYAPTIISGERKLSEVIAVDEALGTRIAERAKEFTLNISADNNKNQRMRRNKDE